MKNIVFVTNEGKDYLRFRFSPEYESYNFEFRTQEGEPTVNFCYERSYITHNLEVEFTQSSGEITWRYPQIISSLDALKDRIQNCVIGGFSEYRILNDKKIQLILRNNGWKMVS